MTGRKAAPAKADPVNHPAHYTSHPSGVECIEAIEWFPANLANAWKYLHREDLKGSGEVDLQKARWYVAREMRRRRILARRGVQPYRVAGWHPATLRARVRRFLRHETGLRRDLFAALWTAFLYPVELDPLATADKLLAGLIFSSKQDAKK